MSPPPPPPLIPDAGILRAVGELQHATSQALQSSQKLKSTFDLVLAMAKFAVSGQWKQMNNCSRVVGQMYFIRRVWNRTLVDPVCVAEWTTAGWVPHWGVFTETAEPNATVDQWCWD